MTAKIELRKIALRGAELGGKEAWVEGQVHNSYRTLYVEGDIPMCKFPGKMSWKDFSFAILVALGLALVLAYVGIFLFHNCRFLTDGCVAIVNCVAMMIVFLVCLS